MVKKTLFFLLFIIILSSCTSIENNIEPTQVVDIETTVYYGTAIATSCISGPNNVVIRTPEAVTNIDLAKYEIKSKSIIDPIPSPNGEYLALWLSEKDDNGTNYSIVVLNLKKGTQEILLSYYSTGLQDGELSWSLNSKWVVFNEVIQQNYVMSIDGKFSHFIDIKRVYGWSDDGALIYFSFKDSFGYMDSITGEVVEIGNVCQN